MKVKKIGFLGTVALWISPETETYIRVGGIDSGSNGSRASYLIYSRC